MNSQLIRVVSKRRDFCIIQIPFKINISILLINYNPENGKESAALLRAPYSEVTECPLLAQTV
jgi:hypothetical protein